MNGNGNARTRRNQQLDEAIAAYCAARDAGQAPAREQFLAAYPALRTELNAFLQADDEVTRQNAPLSSATQPAMPTGASATLPRQTLSEAERWLGDYELLEPIGQGGAGVVWKARQKSLQRLVAIKMMRSGPLTPLPERQRFRREAETVASLDHPHIVPVLEVGEHQDRLFFAMKLLTGGNVAQQGQRYVQDPRAAAQLVATVARAVHYAHQRGILHRDLKPANILLDEHGQPHVTDFGLARRLTEESDLTRTGELLGTPSYMAPEQTLPNAAQVTTATDVYGLGAVLYALLTGRPPFSGTTVFDTLTQVRDAEPPPPRSLQPHMDRDLEIICLKCLRKAPAQRYGSADALAQDLDNYLAGDSIRARPSRPRERLWRWVARRPALAALVLLALFTVASLAGGIVWHALELESELDRLAQQLRQESTQREEELRGGQRLTRQLLYAADVRRAFQAWKAGELDQARAFLARCEPKTGEEDLRGFEWHYLHGQMRSRLLGRLPGPATKVLALAFTPDGKTLYSSRCKESCLRLHDVATGASQGTLPGHPDHQALALQFMDGGKRLMGDQYQWNRDSGTGVVLVPGSGCDDYLRYAALTAAPDERLAIAGRKAQLMRLGPKGATPVPGLANGHDDQWHHVAFATRSPRFATVSESGAARVFELPPGSEQPELLARRDHLPARKIALSPDGRTLVVVGEKGITLWDIANDRTLPLVGHREIVLCASFAPDGRTLATGGHDRTVRLWDLATHRAVAVLSGHQDIVATLAFSPDGRLLASGDCSGNILLWDAVPVPAWMEPQTVACTGLAEYAPDGKLLALVAGNNDIHLVDSATGTTRTILRGNGQRLAALAFAPDGQWLATAGADRMLRIRDLSSGAEKAAWQGSGATLTSIAIAPCSQVVASAGFDGVIRLWDATTGQLLHQLQGHQGHVEGVAFSADGCYLASASLDQTVKIWDTASGKLVRTLQAAGPAHALAWAHKGTLLAAAADSRVELWDGASGQHRGALEDSAHCVLSLSFSPDDCQLAASGPRLFSPVWDVASLKWVKSLKMAGGEVAATFRFAPDGGHLLLATDCGGVYLWDRDSWHARSLLVGPVSAVVGLAFTPDGSGLVSCSSVAPFVVRGRLLGAVVDQPGFGAGAGSLRLWDPQSGLQLAVLPEQQPMSLTSFALSRDGRLAAAATAAGAICRWDVAGRQCLPPLFLDEAAAKTWEFLQKSANSRLPYFPHEKSPIHHLAAAPDGRALVGIDAQGDLWSWNLATGQRLAEPLARKSSACCFGPTGGELATGWEREVRLLHGGQADRTTLPGHHPASALAYAPNGKLLAAGSPDGTLTIYPLGSKAPPLTLGKHRQVVTALAFAPDGKTLASGSGDSSVRLWQVATGQELFALDVHDGTVTGLAFSPDGRILASGSQGPGRLGQLLFWHLSK